MEHRDTQENRKDLTQLDFAHFLYASALQASGLPREVVMPLVHNARKIADISKNGEETTVLYAEESLKVRILIGETMQNIFTQGKDEGYETGIVTGFNRGYEEAFERGRRDGYRVGQAKAYEKGKAILNKASLAKVFAGMLLGAAGTAAYNAYSKTEQGHLEVVKTNERGNDPVK